MVCHVCGKAAVGQCIECWKFYCRDHGNRICSPCLDRRKQARLESERQVAQMAADHPEAFEADSKLLMGEYGISTPPTPEQVAHWRQLHMEGDRLKRVVPIVQSTDWGEKRFTLSSIELFEDGSRLLYIVVSPDEPQFRSGDDVAMLSYFASKRPDLRVEDDIGSHYHVSGGGGGGGKVWHGQVSITPRVPDAAKKLSVFARLPDLSASTTGLAPEHRFDIAL